MGYLVNRLIMTVITLFVILTVTFTMFRLMPGDPSIFFISPQMSTETIARIKAQFGLDQPIHKQFTNYLGSILHGNFGHSFFYKRPVLEVIGERLLNTIILFLPAAIISYLVGVSLGRYMAWKRGGTSERVLIFTGLSFWTFFVPWLGLLMIWVLSYKFGLFPVGGMITPDKWLPGSSVLVKALDLLHHLASPLICYVLTWFAGNMLIMRNSMLETIGEDYILTVRAKGLSERKIRNKHAARNAILPVVTAFSMSIAYAIGGCVLLETVFSWPGIGRTMVDSVLLRDYPLAQASFILIATVVLVTNLITDILYAYLDPRIRY